MNSIVTMAIGARGMELLSLTGKAMSLYAEKIGADFTVINEDKIKIKTRSSRWSVVGNKFQMVDMLNKYDRLCYIDADILVTPSCGNIFEHVPDGNIGWSIHPEKTQHEIVRMTFDNFGLAEKLDDTLDASVVSGGMLVFSKCHADVLRATRLVYQCGIWLNEELPLHMVCRLLCPNMTVLDTRYNYIYLDYPGVADLHMTHIFKRLLAQNVSGNIKEDWKSAYSIHYTCPNELGGVKAGMEALRRGVEYFYGWKIPPLEPAEEILI